MKRKLEKAIREALVALNAPDVVFSVEYPTDLALGDYSTNAALVLASAEKKNPRDIAGSIQNVLKLPSGIEKIEVAGPGFLNFFLKGVHVRSMLKEIQRNDTFGKTDLLKGRQVIIEYTDPNPFKEFHVGHLMNNTIGEALSRIVEWNGATVKRACYQGDVGLHVAKALWAVQNLSRPSLDAPFDEQVQFLGRAYALGATRYEEDEAVREEIKQINKEIYEGDNKALMDLYSWGREVSLRYFEDIYKLLGTHFDYYFFESESGEIGKNIVLEYAKKGVFEESEGAHIFPGEKYGLHTRVFLNQQGLPTYEAKELGLAELKYQKFKYDESLVVTGNEVNDYFKVLLEAMKHVFPELAEKTKHFGHGMLRLPEGKMSSRTGDVITAREFISSLYDDVVKRMEEDDISEEEKHRVAQNVAVASIKYQILKQGIGHDVIFSRDKALSLEGDSGPYLLYSRVRAHSVLRRAQRDGIAAEVKSGEQSVGELERLLPRFPEIVERSYNEKAPQLIVHYLTDLASRFNSFYASTPIIEGGDEAPYRLGVTEAFERVMRNGIEILGMRPVDRM